MKKKYWWKRKDAKLNREKTLRKNGSSATSTLPYTALHGIKRGYRHGFIRKLKKSSANATFSRWIEIVAKQEGRVKWEERKRKSRKIIVTSNTLPKKTWFAYEMDVFGGRKTETQEHWINKMEKAIINIAWTKIGEIERRKNIHLNATHSDVDCEVGTGEAPGRTAAKLTKNRNQRFIIKQVKKRYI